MPSLRACAAAAIVMVCAACSGEQAPPAAQSVAPAASVPSASYLPLPSVPFPAARPMPIVEAAFHFAADHPEVLSHMPCFCGCEHRGHEHNDDCFVAARDERGRVTAWEPHGIG